MRINREQIDRLRRNRRGAAAVEYVLLLILVAVPTIIGITSGGVIMLNGYRTGRDAMLKPTP